MASTSKRMRTSVDETGGKRKASLLSSQATVEESMNQSQMPDFRVAATVNKKTEVGIIEQVMVKNFMCHTMQDVKFGPQVNFVIGRNGSGKSAILTAIVVGLGGKANVTSRGSSLKSFIQSGKHSAEVIIKLRNKGCDAYKHDLYGDSIIVERKITKEGTSSYKLKSFDGKLVSTKREELNHVLDTFNIQVDNPLVILNQETSRHFLHSKNSHDKYKFFLKATQLEQMRNDYCKADECKEIANDILQQKCKTLPVLEKEVFNWEEKYRAATSLQDLKEKKDMLQDELVWAAISTKEKGLEPIARELRQEEARIPKYRQKVKESEEELKGSEEKYQKIEHNLEALSETVRLVEPKYREGREKIEKAKLAKKSTQADLKKCEKEIVSHNADLAKVKERIEEIRNSTQLDNDSERKTREARIMVLKDKIETLESQKRTAEQEIEEFQNAAQLLKEQQYRIRSEEQDVKQNIDNTKRRLANLESSRNNHMRKFGAHVPELLRRIQEAYQKKHFKKMPRGPVGARISLRQPQWGLAVECALKGLIHSFCVDNHHDERILEQIVSQVCPDGKRPSTITGAFADAVYDVQAERPVTNKYHTVLEVLDVEDPVIANCLIDQRGVEGILLIEDNKDARETMMKRPPTRAKEAFTMQGDQIYCVPNFRWYSSNQKKANYLTASLEDDIRASKDELSQYEGEQTAVHQRMDTLTKELRQNETECRKSQTRLNKLIQQISHAKTELTDLSSIEDPVPVDIRTLEEEISRLEDLIHQQEDRRLRILQLHQAAEDEFMRAEQAFQELESQFRKVTEDIDPIKENLAAVEGAIATAKSHKKHYDAKNKEHDKKVAELRNKLEQFKKELEEHIGNAEKICERINTRRTYQNLESEIKQIEKQIAAEEKSRGNPTEIMTKYNETKNSFLQIRKEVRQFQNFLSGLDRIMAHRTEQFGIFRLRIAERAMRAFILMLCLRKYLGSMTFDHEKENLELVVHPQDKAMAVSSTDMRALSGGERSFSTVCFILSLWEAMESPFRCLDEFDVFMDMVNRRISMEMMMGVAEDQPDRQFIFLTPQDMSTIRIKQSMVRIFQMRAPVRGQGTLPFNAGDGGGESQRRWGGADGDRDGQSQEEQETDDDSEPDLDAEPAQASRRKRPRR